MFANSKSAFRMTLIRISAVIITAVAFLDQASLASPCGDINASAQIDISDAVYLIQFIFDAGAPPLDDAGGDLNCNGQTDITDAVYIIHYICKSK